MYPRENTFNGAEKETVGTSSETTGAEMVPVVKPKASLFQMTMTFAQLMEVAEENDGELTEDQLQTLQITRDGLESKVLGYGHFIKHLEGQVALAESEEKRIQAFKKTKKRQVDVLKTALLRGLMTFGDIDPKGIYRLEVTTVDGVMRLSTRKSESVVITDEDALPAEFWRQPVIPDVEPDKKAIKEALDSGNEVPGAAKETSYSLSIK